MQAYDADEGQNAELTYSLSGRDWEGGSTVDLPITVDNKTGWIYTTRLLDRETQAKYQFQVKQHTFIFCSHRLALQLDPVDY